MIPKWAIKLPWNQIEKAAREEGVNPCLLGAIVMKESSGDCFATRFEPKYQWLSAPDVHAKNLRISFDTEIIHQKTSWGLCQIMGGVLRELGFCDHIPRACTPALNLSYGAKLLARLQQKYPRVEDAVAAYNAGSPRDENLDGRLDNEPYVKGVIAYFDELTGRLN